MNRIIVLFVCLVMAASLVGCSTKRPKRNDSSSGVITSTSENDLSSDYSEGDSDVSNYSEGDSDVSKEQSVTGEDSTSTSDSEDAEEFSVTFNLNGGIGSANEQTVQKGALVIQPEQPTKEGWAFGGWVTADERVYDFNGEVNSSFTLFAKWEPIKISTAQQLLDVNCGEKYNYVLTQDIDFSGKTFRQIGVEQAFKGVFDGNGYSVKGINFTSAHSGVFDFVEGTIKNLKVEANVSLTNYKGSTVYSGLVASRLVGGQIVGCTAKGDISISCQAYPEVFAGAVVGRVENGGTIQKCFAESQISVLNAFVVYAGGIVGYSGREATVFSKVINCVFNGSVTGQAKFVTGNSADITEDNFSSYVGGIVGDNGGIIDACVSYGGKLKSTTGDYWCFAGGIAGDNHGGKVTNCLAVNDVSVTTDSAVTYRGAVCGRNFATSVSPYVFENNYAWDGQTVDLTVTNPTYLVQARHQFVQSKSVSADVISSPDWCERVFGKNITGQSGYLPYLNEEFKVANDLVAPLGTYGNPIVINTLNELRSINYTKCYKLGSDITVNADWESIGNYANPFFGSLDGNGHTISGINITNSNGNYCGLFGYFAGKVSNLNVQATSSINAQNSATLVGGIVAFNQNGFVENCTANVNFTVSAKGITAGAIVAYNDRGEIKNCVAIGSISATGLTETAMAGGICGNNINGNINGCENRNTVTIIGKQSAYSGGIAGKNNGNITNCSNTVTIYSRTNSGTNAIVGGLVGYNYDVGKVLNSYSIGAVSASQATVLIAGWVVGQNDSVITNCYAYSDGAGYGAGANSVDTMSVTKITASDLNTLSERLGSAWSYDEVLGRPVVR